MTINKILKERSQFAQLIIEIKLAEERLETLKKRFVHTKIFLSLLQNNNFDPKFNRKLKKDNLKLLYYYNFISLEEYFKYLNGFSGVLGNEYHVVLERINEKFKL